MMKNTLINEKQEIITAKKLFDKNTIENIQVTTVPSFKRYYELQEARLEKEKQLYRRRLYSSDDESEVNEDDYMPSDDDFYSCDDWSDNDEDRGETYDAGEFDRHRG